MMPTEEEINELVKALAFELTGRHPLVQGAALADAVAIFFVAHHPSVREEMVDAWIIAMRKLIDANEAGLQANYPDFWLNMSN